MAADDRTVRSTTALHAPGLDRLRLLEAEHRLRGVRHAIELLLVAGIAAIGLTTGASSAAAAAVVLVVLGSALERHAQRAAAPAFWLALQEVFFFAAVVIVVANTGGLASPGLLLLGLCTALAGARRRGAPLVVTLASQFSGVVTACSTSGAPTPEHAVAIAVCAAAGALGVALLTSHLTHGERGVRADAVLDPLTGLLNRGALDARMIELGGQAALDDLPLSVVLCDLDALAQINADHGTHVGDDVLTGAAEAMRRALRSFELLYRLGGDEFLLVLPGATPAEALRLAERLRDAVVAAQPGGQDVTASFGVAGGSGARLQFGALLAEADVALYEAKAAGGDTVRLAGDEAATVVPIARSA